MTRPLSALLRAKVAWDQATVTFDGYIDPAGRWSGGERVYLGRDEMERLARLQHAAHLADPSCFDDLVGDGNDYVLLACDGDRYLCEAEAFDPNPDDDGADPIELWRAPSWTWSAVDDDPSITGDLLSALVGRAWEAIARDDLTHVARFPLLHDYVDANEYLQVAGYPWRIAMENVTVGDSMATLALANEITAALDAVLLILEGSKRDFYEDAEEALGGIACGHDVPMVCHDCRRPAYYDYGDNQYHHALTPLHDCFLIGAEARPDEVRHPLHPATLGRDVSIGGLSAM